jgi:type 1 glutamine amidotransferase
MKFIFLILFFKISLCLISSANQKKNIIFILAEREYQTEQTLPKFAKQYLTKQFVVKFCHAPQEGPQRNLLSNPSFIAKAHLLVVSVRRRAFKEETMNLIREHVSSAKPIIGLRTSSHAFDLKKSPLPNGHQMWTEWDNEIMGGNYNGHHGKNLICTVQKYPNLVSHPIISGIKFPFETPASLYRNSPLPQKSIPLLSGKVKGFPAEPIAWTHQTSFGGKVFYTSLGHVDDFKKPAFQTLLTNAIKWSLRKK